MRNAVKLFRIKGIPVGVHWIFLLVSCWILFVPIISRGDAQSIGWTALGVLSIWACVMLHELGHTMASMHAGIPVKNIRLLPTGGLPTIAMQPEKTRHQLLITFAGPAVNLFIALLLLPFLDDYTPFWDTHQLVFNITPNNYLVFLHNINVMLVVFNLLPAFPMDMERLLPPQASLMGTRVLGVLFFIGGTVTLNRWLVFFGLYLLLMGATEKRLVLKPAVKNVCLGDIVNTDFKTVNAGFTMEEANAYLLGDRHRSYVVLNNQAPIGIIDSQVIHFSQAPGYYRRKVYTMMDKDVKLMNGNMTIFDCWDELPEEHMAQVPVVKDGRLLGVVSRETVKEYLIDKENAVSFG